MSTPATHYAHPADGLAVCATPARSPRLTTDPALVTCTRCNDAD